MARSRGDNLRVLGRLNRAGIISLGRGRSASLSGLSDYYLNRLAGAALEWDKRFRGSGDKPSFPITRAELRGHPEESRVHRRHGASGRNPFTQIETAGHPVDISRAAAEVSDNRGWIRIAAYGRPYNDVLRRGQYRWLATSMHRSQLRGLIRTYRERYGAGHREKAWEDFGHQLFGFRWNALIRLSFAPGSPPQRGRK